MNSLTTPLPAIVPTDEDPASHARPGHGTPTQDADSAAQFPLEPSHAEHEASAALMGGGVVAGMATGAAIGVAVAGPVGVVVGATLGGVAGAVGGAAAGAIVSPGDSSSTESAPGQADPVPGEFVRRG